MMHGQKNIKVVCRVRGPNVAILNGIRARLNVILRHFHTSYRCTSKSRAKDSRKQTLGASRALALARLVWTHIRQHSLRKVSTQTRVMCHAWTSTCLSTDLIHCDQQILINELHTAESFLRS